MTIGMWIAALIAVLCLCALGYLLNRQEPGSKPITALDGLPEQHWIGPADWKQALIAEEPTMDRKPKVEYRYRSAITGKFVKAAYAKRYPHRTVRSKTKTHGQHASRSRN